MDNFRENNEFIKAMTYLDRMVGKDGSRLRALLLKNVFLDDDIKDANESITEIQKRLLFLLGIIDDDAAKEYIGSIKTSLGAMKAVINAGDTFPDQLKKHMYNIAEKYSYLTQRIKQL